MAILRTALELRAAGRGEFYGYLIASSIKDRGESRTLTAHGTLYKALDRMRTAGLLTSRWEDPQAAADEDRPRRRLYEVSALGAAAFAEAERSAPNSGSLNPGLQPS